MVRLKLFLCIFFLLTSWAGFAQRSPMYLEHAELLSYDKGSMDCQVFSGNVRFRQDKMLLFCDIAYYYSRENVMRAFGNVRIKQGNDVTIYGDRMMYDGNTGISHIRRNVRLISGDLTLTTDSLDYDRENDRGIYKHGGKLVDKQNTLTSKCGEFKMKENDNLFWNNVKLVNEDMIITTDSLRYDANKKTMYFVTATNIDYKEDTKIYTEKGIYNTETEITKLFKNSRIKRTDGKQLRGDTIFYNKNTGIGEAFHRAEMLDTVQQIMLRAHYIYYNELTEQSLARDSALLMDCSSADTLFLHAKLMLTLPDSSFTIGKAIGNVRFFHEDMQGRCDSLIYTSRDSIVSMYSNPILWSDNNQLSGDFIQIYTKDNKMDWMHIQQSAFSIEKIDSTYYNQMIGKDLKAFTEDGVLKRIEVTGNAQTIYFPKDESNGSLVGLNRGESSKITIHLTNRKLDWLVMSPASKGVIYPLENLTAERLYFPGFIWQEDLRPKDKMDVFTEKSPVEPAVKKIERKRKR